MGVGSPGFASGSLAKGLWNWNKPKTLGRVIMMSNPVTGNNISQCVVSVNATAKLVGSRGGSRIFERGGPGAETGFFTSTPPPLGHCPRDIIRPQKNWKTPPLLDSHKHTHTPLDIARVTSSTFQGGAGWSPLSHTHPGSATGVHLRSTSKKGGGGPRGGPTLGPMLKSLHRGPKGGGVRTPWTPPPGSATGLTLGY